MQLVIGLLHARDQSSTKRLPLFASDARFVATAMSSL